MKKERKGNELRFLELSSSVHALWDSPFIRNENREREKFRRESGGNGRKFKEKEKTYVEVGRRKVKRKKKNDLGGQRRRMWHGREEKQVDLMGANLKNRLHGKRKDRRPSFIAYLGSEKGRKKKRRKKGTCVLPSVFFLCEKTSFYYERR